MPRKLVADFGEKAPIASKERRDELLRILNKNPLGIRRVSELFNKGELTARVQRLVNDGYKNCARRTIQVPLRQMTAWAASADIFPFDPLQAWKKLNATRSGKKRRALRPQEVVDLHIALAELDELYRRSFTSIISILTILLTGNRLSVLIEANIVDLLEDAIRLPEGKGNKRNGAATLPMAFRKLFAKYFELRSKPSGDSPLLVSQRGQRLDRKNLLDDFKRGLRLMLVKARWPHNEVRFAEVRPIEVAHMIEVGEPRGFDGPAPADPVKIDRRRAHLKLVTELAAYLSPFVQAEMVRLDLYCLRKTHITWARRLVSPDAVMVQVGHAPQEGGRTSLPRSRYG